MPKVFVVAWLADANGDPITAENKDNASYIRTELFNCDDAAWSFYSELSEEKGALFASCQDERGESIV
ncbi:hypothetical protein SR18_gp022 [Caulobacter phage SR18]|nr:hypothetical protein SR18_gp022 [Caulobacter phage SR18]